jgi:plasmid stabilization system protein ParE
VRVEFSDEAKRDLEAIAAFIARDSPLAAERWVDRLADRALKLAVAPHAGRVVPEFKDPLVRQVLVRTYRIIYRVEPHRVLVLTVVEGHRRLVPGG